VSRSRWFRSRDEVQLTEFDEQAAQFAVAGGPLVVRQQAAGAEQVMTQYPSRGRVVLADRAGGALQAQPQIALVDHEPSLGQGMIPASLRHVESQEVQVGQQFLRRQGLCSGTTGSPHSV